MSFFDEVQKFLSQFVENSNWFTDNLKYFLSLFKNTIIWVDNFSSSDIPSIFAWILPLVMLATVFEFVRGR